MKTSLNKEEWLDLRQDPRFQKYRAFQKKELEEWRHRLTKAGYLDMEDHIQALCKGNRLRGMVEGIERVMNPTEE